MRFKLIACDVFLREACACIAASANTIDLALTEKGSHDRSDRLRATLQLRIDEASTAAVNYDAILLLLGLCGNATAGLAARTVPLVVPRAHDCCTLFLGSKERFKEHFREHPSRGFSSAGYLERDGSYLRESSGAQSLGLDRSFEEYAAQYGEENARYIMESLKPAGGAAVDDTVVFIDTPETHHLGYAERCRLEAERDGKRLEILPGDSRLIRKLIDGDWPADEFLVVPPGKRIAAVYDWDEVIRAE